MLMPQMNEETRCYIEANLDADVRRLALNGSRDEAVDMQLALQQIAGRQTARRKLPSWAALPNILYPQHLGMEQCSSEQTARYKQSVCRSLLSSLSSAQATMLVDLTGGFGVDFSFLAPLFRRAVYVERQEVLCQLARHNFAVLGVNAEVVCGNGEDMLHQLEEHVTMIFLDPARRDTNGARTYGISDCTPDVLTLLDELLQKADFVMLKLSPMLDWRKTVSDLGEKWVREVHIVSTGGECKELLLVLSANGSEQPLRLVCINDEQVFESANTHLAQTVPTAHSSYQLHELPQTFLYEPNASVMKAGCFAELQERFGVAQLSQNSHLFVSNGEVEDFPGRSFRVVAVSTMNKRELKEKIAPLKQANITVRNFPLSVAELRKRLKISEGGSNYIFATTLANGDHVLIICERL